MSIDDYGPHAGDGTRFAHLPEHRIQATPKPGRLSELDAFLREQTDPVSQWLLTFDPIGDQRGFNEALAYWVRKRESAGLAVPDCVDQQRRRA